MRGNSGSGLFGAIWYSVFFVMKKSYVALSLGNDCLPDGGKEK